jgi:hypothetical protein
MRLALVGGFLIAVDEHHVDARLRGDIGDAGAHEAGAEHAESCHRLRRHPRRPPRAFVELLHGDEERADHRRRLLGLQHMREVAALDAERRVHRQLQPLEHRLEERPRAGIIVVGLLAIERVGRGPQLETGRREHPRRAFRLVALLVPLLRRLQPAGDHRLRRLDQFFARRDLVDELHRQRALGVEARPLQQELQPGLRVGHAHDPLGAAGAGKNPDLHLRQRDFCGLVVGHDAAVRGERQLRRAAHAGAGDRHDERFSRRLQPAIKSRHAA